MYKKILTGSGDGVYHSELLDDGGKLFLRDPTE
jgi:hypothetical protein